MSDHYDSEFIVNDNNNTAGGCGSCVNTSGGDGGNIARSLLTAVIVVLVVMIIISFVMPRKHKYKKNKPVATAAKAVHNHPGCVNHGKVFDDLLVQSNFYDSKKQGFQYINWNGNQ